MTTLNVRVWSDIVCPWATLALDTLHAVAEQNDCSLDIEHRSFPLELFNEEGTSKPLLDVEMAGIAGLRTRLGWQPWASPDSTFPVTSLPALAAVRATAARSGNRAADELDTALRRAFFAESRCISLTSVILDVAAGLEHVDEKALAEDIAAGRGMQEVSTTGSRLPSSMSPAAPSSKPPARPWPTPASRPNGATTMTPASSACRPTTTPGPTSS
ncbi:DsbA family oxidoreductase [Mobilicoccus massiliensis]|uniref:DsbA family oxidoreductase n=1 Tax=Mobilicoccus massiliensis TaxID=1522310 RepID=UPI0006937907|nr:DsbA family protein [Mobilicoccus massiliensis]